MNLGLELGPRLPEALEGVVRLTRTAWHDKHGIHTRTSLRWLKRTFKEKHNALAHDADMSGADLVTANIVNLSSSPPGLYKVSICNVSYDRESGTIDDYDYKLIPVPDLVP